ncbi:MAG: hypothetical protein JNN28_05095 [Saprospiraceae bacterium]|nr:hypothetical protein [Saprospiraceae bacterium]
MNIVTSAYPDEEVNALTGPDCEKVQGSLSKNDLSLPHADVQCCHY